MLRKEMEDEPVTIAPNWARDATKDARDAVAAVDEDASSEQDDHPADDVAYRDNPNFGRF